MSGITNADRNYWINYIQEKLNERIHALEEKIAPEIKTITNGIVDKIFEQANVNKEELEELRILNEEEEKLKKRLKEIESREERLVSNIGRMVENVEPHLSYRYYTKSLENLISAIKGAKFKEIDAAINKAYPEREKLANAERRIKERIMLATTTGDLKGILAQLFAEFDITIE